MGSRKGLELSVNFLVSLILALVMLGGGIWLVKLFFGQAEVVGEGLSAQVDTELERLLVSGRRVVVFPDRLDAKVGVGGQVGVGVLNVLGDTRLFGLVIGFDEAYDGEVKVCDADPTTSGGAGDALDCSTSTSAVSLQDGLLDASGSPDNPNNWLVYVEKPKAPSFLVEGFVVENNERVKQAVFVKPPRGAKPGTYIFNVYVLYDNAGYGIGSGGLSNIDDTNGLPTTGPYDVVLALNGRKREYFSLKDGALLCDDITEFKGKNDLTTPVDSSKVSFSVAADFAQLGSGGGVEKVHPTAGRMYNYVDENKQRAITFSGFTPCLSSLWDKKRLYSGSVHKLYVTVH